MTEPGLDPELGEPPGDLPAMFPVLQGSCNPEETGEIVIPGRRTYPSMPKPEGLWCGSPRQSLPSSPSTISLLFITAPDMKELPSTQGESSTSAVVDDNCLTDRVEDSQLFPSIPALNQAASYLAQTASYLSQCLPVPAYLGLTEEDQELVALAPPSAFGCSSAQTSSIEFTGASSSLGQAGCSGSPPQENTGQMVPSSVFQNGTSLFQSLVKRAWKTVRGSADDIGWL